MSTATGPIFVPGLGAVREQGGKPGPGYVDHDPDKIKGATRSLLGHMRCGRLDVLLVDSKAGTSEKLKADGVVALVGKPAALPKLAIKPGANAAAKGA